MSTYSAHFLFPWHMLSILHSMYLTSPKKNLDHVVSCCLECFISGIVPVDAMREALLKYNLCLGKGFVGDLLSLHLLHGEPVYGSKFDNIELSFTFRDIQCTSSFLINQRSVFTVTFAN